MKILLSLALLFGALDVIGKAAILQSAHTPFEHVYAEGGDNYNTGG